MVRLVLAAALLAELSAAAFVSSLGFLSNCQSCAGRGGVRVVSGATGPDAGGYGLALLRRRGGDVGAVELVPLAFNETGSLEGEVELWAVPAQHAAELSACEDAWCRDGAAASAWLLGNAAQCQGVAPTLRLAAAAGATCVDELVVAALSAEECRVERRAEEAAQDCSPGPLLRASLAAAARVRGSATEAAPFLLMGLGAVAACVLPRQFFGAATMCCTCCCRPQPMQAPIAQYPVFSMRPRANS